jgi:hypothetical protein
MERPSFTFFKPPYLSLMKGTKQTQIISAEVSVEGEGGSRAVSLRLHGMYPDRVQDLAVLSGDITNMSAIAKELYNNCPTAAIFGESEWAIATELPNRNLLVCIKPVARETIAEEGSVTFMLDAISLPGLYLHWIHPVSKEEVPCISLGWDFKAPIQKHGTRLWKWTGKGDADILADALIANPWTVFENVIL